MKIKLDERYYVLSDKHQYILGKLSNDRILNVGFFTSIEYLLKEYIAIRCRTKENINSVQELLDHQNSLLAGLNKALQPLRIEVINNDKPEIIIR